MHGVVDIVSSWCRTLLQSAGSSASNACVCRSDSVTRLVQVDIVFELFGDKDGSLDCKALERALESREGSAQHARNLACRGREDTPSMFACLKHCIMPD